MTDNNETTLFICRTCKPDGFIGEDHERSGARFAANVAAATKEMGTGSLQLKAVDCLGVCKRPCTVAISAENKFTYVIGDLEPGRDEEAVLEFARNYAEAEDGITPWRSRPEVVRKGTVARIPPIGAQSSLVQSIGSGDLE